MSNTLVQPGGEGNGEIPSRLTLAETIENWEIAINFFTAADDVTDALSTAIDEINGMNPDIGKRMLVSGEGVKPTLELVDDEGIETDTISGQTKAIITDSWGEITNVDGINCGIHAISVTQDDTSAWRLMHKFRLGSMKSSPAITCDRTDNLTCYVTAGATMLPVEEIESAYKPDHDWKEGAAQLIIGRASLDYTNFLGSTSFRRMTRSKQLRAVSALIEGTERAAGVRDKWVLLEAEYCYAPLFSEGRVYQIPVDIRNMVISGSCLGVDSLERLLLDVQAIRSDKNLLDKGAGLCLVVDPEKNVAEALRLKEGQILFVPITSQDVEACFATKVTDS